MCLKNIVEDVEDLRSDTITVYKLLNVKKGYDYTKNKPYTKLVAPFFDRVYKVGWNVSNSGVKTYIKRPIYVERGIHVCLTEENALEYKQNYLHLNKSILVEMKVNRQDIIAANKQEGQLVAKKVFLSQSEYDRVIKLYNQQTSGGV